MEVDEPQGHPTPSQSVSRALFDPPDGPVTREPAPQPAKRSTAVVVPGRSPLLARYRASPYAKAGSTTPVKHPAEDRIACKILQHVFDKRYCEDRGELALTSLEGDADLSDFPVNFNSLAFCRKVASVIADHFSAIRTLVLDGNGIYTLAHIGKQLALHELSGFQLDLRNNQVKNTSELQHLARLELRGLVLRDNPVAQRPDYHQQCVKMLRSVESLDDVDVTQWRTQLLPRLPEVATLDFSDDQQAQVLATAFRGKYFDLVDSKQFDELADAYAPNVKCTIAATTEPVARCPVTAAYLQGLQAASANLKGNFEKGITQVGKGRLATLQRLKQHLYCYSHDELEVMSIHHDRTNVHMDVTRLGPQVMIVTLHTILTLTLRQRSDDDDADEAPLSQLSQASVNGCAPVSVSRCVDRTWLLGPASGGSCAEWPCVIQNEQVTVRALQTEPVAGTVRRPAAVVQHLDQLQRATGLTDEWVQQLSTAAGHDTKRALVVFEETKNRGGVPLTAYKQRAMA
eukprot:NODE_792_length_1643_cov_69.360818_g782_i0.p1 GENE.NODE_792_length_1643_cov_69.360818_g782_i0~~NODE_792_length_1643_cov_69.360818_g782_i0.p1  ORF type:complete len:515 (-),score=83.71 NODE_792_length_1643_cov_69.360818_g782_i0:27-1571(-)